MTILPVGQYIVLHVYCKMQVEESGYRCHLHAEQDLVVMAALRHNDSMVTCTNRVVSCAVNHCVLLTILILQYYFFIVSCAQFSNTISESCAICYVIY